MSAANDSGTKPCCIATPSSSHRDYALRVAAAGQPVTVEKPMARTAAECDEMIAACALADVPLFVAYYRRAMPRFEAVRDLLDGGAIGTPQSVSVRLQRRPVEVGSAELPWRLRPEIPGGGLFVDPARRRSTCPTGCSAR